MTLSSSTQKLSPTHDLICGALAGSSSRLIVAPLDVLKIRFQVQSETRGLYQYSNMIVALRTIVSREGIGALWKGNVPAMLMVTPYASLQLSAFYQLKQSNLATMAEPYNSLALGGISGAFATLCTYPLDLLRTRFAAQTEPKQYYNIRHAIAMIFSQHGVRGFYAGLQPTLIEIVPYISLHFALYESAKNSMLRRTESSYLSMNESMAIGSMSGAASKLLTLPLDNAKKLIQVEAQFQSQQTSSYRGIGHVLYSIWKRDGIRGWFRGTAPSLLKAAPNSAITFAVYETAKRLLSSE